MNPYAPGDTNVYSNNQVQDPEFPRHGSLHLDGGGVEKFKRTSNKWIAAAYNITAIVGVGVLALPHAMVFLTWVPGLVVLLLAFFMTLFTMSQLIQLHELGEFDDQNRSIRNFTYHILAQRAFRSKKDQGVKDLKEAVQGKAFWITFTLQMLVEVSLDILFTISAGEAMNRIHDKHTHCNPVHLFVWFAVFAIIQIILSAVLPTFEDIKWIVVPAAILSVCYSTTAWITIVATGGPKDVYYRLPKELTVDNCAKNLDLTHTDLLFRAFNAIGVIAFAYAAHNVVLEIQNGIPSTPERPSEKEMKFGMWITYVVVAVCYFPMAIAVYKIHGNQMSQNVLSFIQYHIKEAPKGVVIAANSMLILHLIGSYQIFAVPVFTQLGTLLQIKPRNSQWKRFFIKASYIGLTTLLAMIFPYFSPLLGLFGGLAIAPTTYFLPCIFWLKINDQRRWKSKSFYFNLVCVILGILLMIVATIGGVLVLTKEAISDDFQIWRPNNWKTSRLYSTKESCTLCHSTCLCTNF